MAEGSQQQRQFGDNTGPASNVGVNADAPTHNTTPFQATAAQYTSAAPALQDMGAAFGSFFNTAATTLQQVDAVNAFAERTDIQRENENLKLQGAVDLRAGRPMATAYANRQAYAGAYQQASAENHAFEMAEGFKTVLNALPRDGTQDPMAAAQAYWKQQIGKGTGDRDYDAKLMGLFTQNAQAMVGAADEQKMQDQERVATNSIIQAQAAKLKSQDGFTVGDVADMRGQLLTVAHGDPVKADKLLVSIMGTADTNRQTGSFREALKQLPVGKDADGNTVTWAQKNPEVLQRVEKEALDRVTSIKTIDGYNAYSRWKQRAAELKGNPFATANDMMGLLNQAVDIDKRHSIGADKFLSVIPDIREFFKNQAKANVTFMSFTGTLNGSHNGHDYEVRFGPMTDADKEQGISAIAQRLPGFEALAQSAAQTGLVNPQYSDDAMTQAARLLATSEMQQTMQGEMAPKSLKQKMFGALGGSDPQEAARSYMGAHELERQGVSDMLLSKFFPNPEAETVYRSLKSMGVDGQDAQSVYKGMMADPIWRDQMAKGQKSGEWNLPQVAGFTGTEAAAFQKKIDDSKMKLARLGAGRQNTFWFNKDVGMNSAVSSEIDGLIRKDFAVQKASTGSVDLDKAMSNVATTVAGRYLLVPSMDGKLQLVANQFGTRGQAVNDPLNREASSPISVAKGYPPVYSGAPMKNALGETEDPHDTMGKDIGALSKALPSAFADTKNIWTNQPDNNGLMLLKQRGMPVQFEAGQGIDLPTTQTKPDPYRGGTWEAPAVKAEKVPSDPQEAAAFFKRVLPPGFIAIPNGMNGAWQVHYGFRLLGDADRAAAKAKDAEVAIDARNSAFNGWLTQQRANLPADPSKAAFIYPHVR